MAELSSKIKRIIVAKSLTFWGGIKNVGIVFKRESRETKAAARILVKMVKGKTVTDDEIDFLKGQSADIGKALAVIGLQAVPCSSFAIIAIEKAMRVYGFTLFPQEQELPEEVGEEIVCENVLLIEEKVIL
jgi:hypothetical protein